MDNQFVIIGCGRFGSAVAKKLMELNKEVMVVDNNEETIQNISEKVTYAVQADATDENTIKSLGISNFDVAIVTIGENIQASLLVTLMVKELGLKKIISKAKNELHARILYKIGANRVVFPEREMGIKVAKNLVSKNVLDFIELAPEYSVMEILALDEWVGKSLKEIDMRSSYGINVMAIKHGDDINISLLGDYVIKENDTLVVIGHNDDLSKIERT
ncbi:MAG: potassium channel family protein [Bacillota bacterium]